jgi:hypothetical protein
VFNAALSGVIGPFSVGGSNAPPEPQVGTQPLPVFTTLQDTRGAPLPGWALSVTNNGVAVTVDYHLVSGAPVHLTHEASADWFVFVFDYIHPVIIDASHSTVTYSPTITSGATFAETSFTCESGDPLHPTCGSLKPSASITVDLAPVPEPSTAALLVSGLAVAAVALRRRLTRSA